MIRLRYTVEATSLKKYGSPLLNCTINPKLELSAKIYGRDGMIGYAKQFAEGGIPLFSGQNQGMPMIDGEDLINLRCSGMPYVLIIDL